MATGSVELIGTQIGSTGSNGGSGNDITKVVDGDFTTFYDAANVSGDWVGIDAGAACTVTSWKFAPRRGASGITEAFQYESRMEGGKLQASSTADFSSDVTDCDTITNMHTYHSLHFNERASTSPPSKRYWRYLGPTSARCNIAELRFIASAGLSAAKPCQPTISPWGGNYLAHPVVTLASTTTSASLYYTIDGTTPDNTKTLYSGPFLLPVTGGVTLKVVAYDASLDTVYSDVSTAAFRDYGLAPRDALTDQYGNRLEWHVGGLVQGNDSTPLLIGGYYYNVGLSANRYSNLASSWNAIGLDGIWLFRSTDLYNWELVGQILDNTLTGNTYTISPQIRYCASTSKYVLWCHIYSPAGATTNLAGVAQSSSIESGWSWVTQSLDPDGAGCKGPSLFQDGTNCYLVYNDAAITELRISQLASDYLTTLGTPVQIQAGAWESAAHVKFRGLYYWFFGVANYYDSVSATVTHSYIISTAATSGFTVKKSLVTGELAGTDYNIQQKFAFIQNGGVVIGGDFFVPDPTYDSTKAWLPVETLMERPTSWNFSRFNVPANGLRASLAAVYELDELSGDAIDQIGALDAAATGAPTFYGAVNRARTFSSGKYFTKTSAAALQVGDIDWWFSVEVRRTGTPTFGRFFVKDDAASSREYSLYFDSSDGQKLKLFGSSGGTTGTAHTVIASTLGNTAANTWYHVIGGYDATNDQLFICVNNGAVDTTSHTGGIFVGTSALKIGSDNAGTSTPDASIRRLRFWKRSPPTSTERTALYNNGIGLRYDQFAYLPIGKAVIKHPFSFY